MTGRTAVSERRPGRARPSRAIRDMRVWTILWARIREVVMDPINISAIRVAGIGGLGLVGMAVSLAWTFPSIAQSLMMGGGLGLVLAAILIAYRRRVGPMPSSSRAGAANTTLHLE